MFYTPHAIYQILQRNPNPEFVKKDGNFIMNEAISFDIEVTSTYYSEEKVAFMYVWMLDIFNCTIIGRTWQEFIEVMNTITTFYELKGVRKRLVIYIHNLSYEYQWLRKLFKWVKVFSLAKRKPLYALTTTGIEFRCSYRLTGYKLEKVGEQVGIEKLTSDFDYTKIRHSKTPLTQNEYNYCIHDVKIVTELIRRKIEEEGSIAEIPLTKTGYVRRYVRNKTLRGSNRCFYKAAIQSLTLEPEEYILAKHAFAGGFTHASKLHAEKERHNVVSKDFTSSYPTVLIAEKYPMTKGERLDNLTRDQFDRLMEREECCIFTIQLKNVQQIFPSEAYISESRCLKRVNSLAFNGRIVKADEIIIDITTIDYNIMKKVYTFDVAGYDHFYHYKKYYLPTSFIECILEFYNIKTKLKDVEGKETEYMNGKENLNSLFGMCVTDIVRDEIECSKDGDWLDVEKLTKEEEEQQLSNQLDKENKKKSRFLFYLWGVFCTAYARKNLWSAIIECKEDYIYSDTDSVKILNYDKHKEYFEEYNKNIVAKLELALDYHKLPRTLIRPRNVKGEEKILGIWDDDGYYLRFKAIRAKAYIYYGNKTEKKARTNPEYHITVAGLSKEDGISYLKELGDPINEFKYGMKIPKERTGKLTHTYIDDPIDVEITDYKDITMRVRELSAVHLESAPYHLSKTRALLDYLSGIKSNVYQ